jgi:hypothetical protein
MFAIQYVLAIAAAFLGGAVVEATLGISDVLSIDNADLVLVSTSTFNCLRRNNYTFYIANLFGFTGDFESFAAQSMKNAAAGNRGENPDF